MALRRYLAAARRRLAPTPPEPGPVEVPSPAPEPDWVATAPSPWDEPTRAEERATAWCNICRWTGSAFEGPQHCEFATCPRCGSIARDRFLFWCFVERTPPSLRTRLLETSPRMGDAYRRAMARWFTYTCSDFDERAHQGTVRIDLQAIDLPDASLDVILTPHVLEHVPETDTALDEIHRVLAPGGRMYLQVPVLQGATAPPTEPEFHGDDTPVFWRFGPDLTARLREHGFTTTLLCTDDWKRRVDGGDQEWGAGTSREFDVTSLLGGSIAGDLVSVTHDDQAARLGFVPAYMFLTWEAVRS
jgi:SAM-dependent methyltransferase